MNRRGHIYNIGETLVYTGNRAYSQKSLLGKEAEVIAFDYSNSQNEPMYKLKFFHYNYQTSMLPGMLHCVFENNLDRMEASWTL